MSKDNFKSLEKKIGYTFKDKNLIKTALTHKTYAFEASSPIEYNERLEFFGDSLLDFIVAEKLYNANKYFSEGELTRRKSSQVNNNFLMKWRIRSSLFFKFSPRYSIFEFSSNKEKKNKNYWRNGI